jgi:hypothetical protein
MKTLILALSLSLLCLPALANEKAKKGGGAWDFEGRAIELAQLKLLEEAVTTHTNDGRECNQSALNESVAKSLANSATGLNAEKIDAHFQGIRLTIQARTCLNRAVNAANEAK